MLRRKIMVEGFDQVQRDGQAGSITRREMLRRAGLGSLAVVGGIALFAVPESANALTVQQAQTIVNAALSVLGVRYTWGGSNPSTGFDCSGLTQWCYAKAGIGLPRTARDQYSACRYCTFINAPGTMLFFVNTNPDLPPGVISHVAIAVGDGSMVSANSTPTPGKVTRVWSWVSNSYWQPKFVTAATL
jgi:cell wall-associated NlpC family hydrolase